VFAATMMMVMSTITIEVLMASPAIASYPSRPTKKRSTSSRPLYSTFPATIGAATAMEPRKRLPPVRLVMESTFLFI
jgi:hypothetical protein